jgi:hypothetical protein
MPSLEALKVVFSPLGIPMNELLPDLTKKWYMLLPVDTRVLGTRSIPLIADNQYVVGEAQIHVEEGQITVSSTYFDDRTVPLRTILHFYKELDDLTPRRIVYRYRGYQLDQPISLEKFEERGILLMYLRIEGIYDERRSINTRYNPLEHQKELQDIQAMFGDIKP